MALDWKTFTLDTEQAAFSLDQWSTFLLDPDDDLIWQNSGPGSIYVMGGPGSVYPIGGTVGGLYVIGGALAGDVI